MSGEHGHGTGQAGKRGLPARFQRPIDARPGDLVWARHVVAIAECGPCRMCGGRMGVTGELSTRTCGTCIRSGRGLRLWADENT